MIADEGCAERGCPMHGGTPGVQMVEKKDWVGLTENEKELLWDEAVDGKEHFCSQYGDFADAIEAALKEKNA